MLSQYHLQFLKVLHSHDVNFLIIGGQAKFIHFTTSTKDLDIWIPVDGENSIKLGCALKHWISVHPQHNDSIAYSNGPLTLKPNMQIHIPMDDAWYMGNNDECLEILVSDGIDILTSLRGMNFYQCVERAHLRDTENISCLYLSTADLKISQTIKNGEHCSETALQK